MIMICLLRYISLKKLFNILKVYLGYFISILFKKVIVIGNPYSLTTEPTNNCNLNCIECPSGNKTLTRKKGNIDLALFQKIVDELKDYLIFQMIYFQGEPFLYPVIFKLINYADKNKIYTCTSTNGHFLSPENCNQIVKSGLKKIIISIDGTSQESYEKYRLGGDLEKVIEGIQNLTKTKKLLKSKFPRIELQYIVFKHNQHQLKEIRLLSRTLGIRNLKLKSAQIDNLEINHTLIPDIEKFARYKTESNQYKIKNSLSNRCFRIWSTMVINWEGNIVPCCFDKDSQYKIGNAIHENVLNVWASKKFMQFRKKIMLHRKNNAICRNCTEGLRINN